MEEYLLILYSICHRNIEKTLGELRNEIIRIRRYII